MSKILVARCTDARLLSKLMQHPAVYPWISDDDSPPANEFGVPQELAEADLFLVPHVDGNPAGFAWFTGWTRATCDYHGALLPGFRGALGIEIGKQVFQHLWDHTPFEKIVALCPTTNRAAQRYNKAMGMKREGQITRAFRKDGELVDLIVYGLSRKED